MAKPMRMIVVALAALWMAASSQPLPDATRRDAMPIALALVVAGCSFTLARRLRRAARALHGGRERVIREGHDHASH
jgi:hypothetical protein